MSKSKTIAYICVCMLVFLASCGKKGTSEAPQTEKSGSEISRAQTFVTESEPEKKTVTENPSTEPVQSQPPNLTISCGGAFCTALKGGDYIWNYSQDGGKTYISHDYYESFPVSSDNCPVIECSSLTAELVFETQPSRFSVYEFSKASPSDENDGGVLISDNKTQITLCADKSYYITAFFGENGDECYGNCRYGFKTSGAANAESLAVLQNGADFPFDSPDTDAVSILSESSLFFNYLDISDGKSFQTVYIKSGEGKTQRVFYTQKSSDFYAEFTEPDGSGKLLSFREKSVSGAYSVSTQSSEWTRSDSPERGGNIIGKLFVENDCSFAGVDSVKRGDTAYIRESWLVKGNLCHVYFTEDGVLRAIISGTACYEFISFDFYADDSKFIN